MKYPYLVRCLESSDWIRHYDEGTQDVNDFYLPSGPHEKNEISDTIYHEGTEVPYHEHAKGYETFFVARGSVDCKVRGKQFTLVAGDILHLPPYVPHGFKFLEEGTIWRELFQEINMAQGIMNKNRVKNNYPGLYDDPEFMTMYRAANGSFPRETPVTQAVEKTDMWEVRTPEFAYSTYCGEGWKLKQKVGRWECNGVKEVWQAHLDKGLVVEYDYPHPLFELYYIAKGSVRFTVLDETFVAEHDCLVQIPPYSKHSMEVLENGTELYDCGCEIRLLALLEDLESIKKNNPEKLEDPVFKKSFLRKYNCYITNCYKK